MLRTTKRTKQSQHNAKTRIKGIDRKEIEDSTDPTWSDEHTKDREKA